VTMRMIGERICGPMAETVIVPESTVEGEA
jgi:hypothetical protein